MSHALIVRLLVFTMSIGVCAAIFAVPSGAQDLTTLRVSLFGAPRSVVMGADLGIFALHGLRLDTARTQSSEQQAQELLDGVWDIASSDADNWIYWTQDKGADFVIFMVSQGSSTDSFYVTDDIQSWDDLRGKTLATDSAFSGQSTMLRLMLLRHNLVADRDYTFLPVGDGGQRLAAIRQGGASGASLGTTQASSAQDAQMHVIAEGSEYLPAYPRSPLATTRRWATSHPDLLLAFIGATIETDAWLLDPANEDVAIGSIVRTDRVSEQQARSIYQDAIASIGDLSTESHVRTDMVQLVEDLRAEVGLMERPTPPTSKFVSPAWYDLALRMRGSAPSDTGD